jgi:hypothetical protein
VQVWDAETGAPVGRALTRAAVGEFGHNDDGSLLKSTLATDAFSFGIIGGECESASLSTPAACTRLRRSTRRENWS